MKKFSQFKHSFCTPDEEKLATLGSEIATTILTNKYLYFSGKIYRSTENAYRTFVEEDHIVRLDAITGTAIKMQRSLDLLFIGLMGFAVGIAVMFMTLQEVRGGEVEVSPVGDWGISLGLIWLTIFVILCIRQKRLFISIFYNGGDITYVVEKNKENEAFEFIRTIHAIREDNNAKKDNQPNMDVH